MQVIEIDSRTYSIQQIVAEKEEMIRLEAVDRCFALSELIDDSSALVRAAVARKKVGHERLVYDESWRVRATVAQNCTDSRLLDVLSKDENEFVRYIVAKRGFALERFVNDCDEEIASLARYAIQQGAVAA